MRSEELITLLEGLDVESAPSETLGPLLAILAATQGRIAARLVTEAAIPRAPTNGHDRLLKVGDASQRLGISTDWLYRHADELPFAVREGGALRFSEAGIAEWIERKRGRRRSYR